MKEAELKELQQIPGIGKNISEDLWNIGIRRIANLKGLDPRAIYDKSNRFEGVIQDRCLLYVFRCAVYFAETSHPDPEKLKWWNWKK